MCHRTRQWDLPRATVRAQPPDNAGNDSPALPPNRAPRRRRVGDIRPGSRRSRWSRTCSAALKFGMGQPVTLRLRSDDRSARLEVQDLGVGVSPDQQARVFGRFEQVMARHRRAWFHGQPQLYTSIEERTLSQNLPSQTAAAWPVRLRAQGCPRLRYKQISIAPRLSTATSRDIVRFDSHRARRPATRN
jgi:hypothetical protein